MNGSDIPPVTMSLIVNGELRRFEAEPRTSLADLLRDEMMLTSVHLGCEHGVCGACTVLMDDIPVRACITLAAVADGRAITTTEGLAGAAIDCLREAFTAEHGLQCGFCTPGMIVAAADLLKRKPRPTDAEIRQEMSGNLCRCTGYVGIVKAIARAASKLPDTTETRRGE